VTVYGRRAASHLALQGFGARLGGLGSGSGWGGGVSWRAPRDWTFGKSLTFSASVTQLAYEQYSVQLDELRFGPIPAFVRVHSNDRPREDFWGLGPHSNISDRSTYRLEETVGTIGLIPPIHGRWSGRLSIAASHNHVTRGRDPEFPASQDIFDPNVYEGLAGSYDFAEYTLGIVHDTRDVPTYARRGNYVFVGVQGAQGINGTPHAYTKFAGEVQQFVSLPGYRRSLGMRLRTVFTDNHGGEHPIPVFRLEAMGSGRTIRGYRTYRFSEEESLLGGLEYRWPIWTIEPPSQIAIDGALFFDFGTAVRDLRDVAQHDMRSGGGFGFRLVTARGHLGRMDVAFSPEGYRFHFSVRVPY
jgi:outer membrane protein assembly factor BamA